jgi:hypothetical protein
VSGFCGAAHVDEWPTLAHRQDRSANFDFPLGADHNPGYFMLAYHLENYLIACKTCNSALKRNYFPVERPRHVAGERPRDLTGERPLLLYPIGRSDDDPEDVITFRGILPIPAARWGHRRRRAQVTIRLFELDTRENLLEERAEILIQLHMSMALASTPDLLTRNAATLSIARLTSDRAAHASCARAHHDLLLTDPKLASEFTQAALNWLMSRP